MSDFDPLDSWFEKGFAVRAQRAAKPVRPRTQRSGSGGGGGRSGVAFSKKAHSNNAMSVLKKSPEVVVKITGNNDGTAGVKAHADYISRNGDIELTDEAGNSIHGKEQVKDWVGAMRASGVPAESKKNEFLHVVFSMPPGTPERQMRESVAEFCKQEFAQRRYVMALHDDKDHCHMHVCVSTRDIERPDAPRLSPRKADLARWRLGFADKLRENGIDAAASKRWQRFEHQKAEHSVVRQIRADNPKSVVFDGVRAEAKAVDRAIRARERPDAAFVGPLRPPRIPRVHERLKGEIEDALQKGERPMNPAAERVERNRAAAVAAWSAVAENLKDSGKYELARAADELVRKGQAAPRSRAQELFDRANQGSAQRGLQAEREL